MFHWYRALKHQGVLGLNQRNQDYVLPYNPRSIYPTVDDKLKTKRLAMAAGMAVPALYDVVTKEHELHDLALRLKPYNAFVVKPAHGAGGDGIWVMETSSQGCYRLVNGEVKTSASLSFHMSAILTGAYSLGGNSDAALVEHRVAVNPCFGPVNEVGIPDIRVVVFMGYPVMAMARLATKASGGKANLHQGGVGVGIDLATGVTFGGVHGHDLVDLHPDTLKPLAGCQVPDWQQVMRMAAQAFDITQLGYLGVDIVLDQEQGPLMLELNARPGLSIQLANRQGLLPRLRQIQSLACRHNNAVERVAYTQREWKCE